MAAIVSAYEPVAHARGQRLAIVQNGNRITQGAGADNDGTTITVSIDGGLLTSPRLTPDGFRFILCHELGHLFGGAPRRGLPAEWTGVTAADGLSVMSSEGQADFYAGAVCFRHLVRGQDHSVALASDTYKITPRLARMCDRAWGLGSEESLICRRAALGGENLLLLVKDFAISFETPDPQIAPVLVRDILPGRQCRLDTIVAAATCRREGAENSLVMSPTDPIPNGCPGQPEAERPPCWYRQTPDQNQQRTGDLLVF
ncbi:MAG: ImmA/IrrE family metallo-endopeptidase [Bdellovibrionales bacterium]